MNIGTRERILLIFLLSFPAVYAVAISNSPYEFQVEYLSSWGNAVIWNFNTKGVIRAAPLIVDIDLDGKNEILITSYDNYIYNLAYQDGLNLRWKFQTGNWISATPSVADLDRDNSKEIIFGNHDGIIYVISPDGELKWSHNIGGQITDTPTIVDLEKDGYFEILVGIQGGGVYCLDHEGNEKWIFNASRPSSPVEVADIGGDGTLEILLGSNDGKIYILNSTGEIIRILNFSSPVKSVVGLPNSVIIVGTLDGHIYWIRNTEIQGYYKIDGSIYSPPSIYDLDLDGNYEILIGTLEGKVYCLSSYNSKKWTFNTGGAIFSSPTAGDIDGDGIYEVLIGNQNGKINCLSHDGIRKWSYNVENPVRASITLGDITGDGLPEILIGNDGNSVKIIMVGEDSDKDGINDADEYFLGTNFFDRDTDKDGIIDSRDENPLNPDRRILNSFKEKSLSFFLLLLSSLVFLTLILIIKFNIKGRLRSLLYGIYYQKNKIYDIVKFISRLPNKFKILLLATLSIFMLVFMVLSFKFYYFMYFDSRMCLVFCHAGAKLMEEPYYLWEESVHGKVTNCHDCHHAYPHQVPLELVMAFVERVTEIEGHAHVPDKVCTNCHLREDFVTPIFNPIVSPSYIKLNSSILPQRSNPSLIGHDVHVGREGISCTECHAPDVHRFLPPPTICEECHYDPTLKRNIRAEVTHEED
jgi:hypothetical protein